MPGSSPDAPTAEARGLLAELAALLGAKLAYLRARFELAGIEGKEALANYAIIGALAIGALVVVVFRLSSSSSSRSSFSSRGPAAVGTRGSG